MSTTIQAEQKLNATQSKKDIVKQEGTKVLSYMYKPTQNWR